MTTGAVSRLIHDDAKPHRRSPNAGRVPCMTARSETPRVSSPPARLPFPRPNHRRRPGMRHMALRAADSYKRPGAIALGTGCSLSHASCPVMLTKRPTPPQRQRFHSQRAVSRRGHRTLPACASMFHAPMRGPQTRIPNSEGDVRQWTCMVATHFLALHDWYNAFAKTNGIVYGERGTGPGWVRIHITE